VRRRHVEPVTRARLALWTRSLSSNLR